MSVCLAFPNFAFGTAIMNMYNNYNYISGCKLIVQRVPPFVLEGMFPQYADDFTQVCTDPVINEQGFYIPSKQFYLQPNYASLQAPGIGLNLIALFAAGFVYLGLLLLVEYRFFVARLTGRARRARPAVPRNYSDVKEDEDVRAERERVARLVADGDGVPGSWFTSLHAVSLPLPWPAMLMSPPDVSVLQGRTR
jgi:hypothetical protein